MSMQPCLVALRPGVTDNALDCTDSSRIYTVHYDYNRLFCTLPFDSLSSRPIIRNFECVEQSLGAAPAEAAPSECVPLNTGKLILCAAGVNQRTFHPCRARSQNASSRSVITSAEFAP